MYLKLVIELRCIYSQLRCSENHPVTMNEPVASRSSSHACHSIPRERTEGSHSSCYQSEGVVIFASFPSSRRTIRAHYHGVFRCSVPIERIDHAQWPPFRSRLKAVMEMLMRSKPRERVAKQSRRKKPITDPGHRMRLPLVRMPSPHIFIIVPHSQPCLPSSSQRRQPYPQSPLR